MRKPAASLCGKDLHQPNNLKEGITMLVLTRKVGERIYIGGGVIITVTAVRGGQVRLGIDAPRSMPIRRGELRRDPEEAAAGAPCLAQAGATNP